MLAIAAAARRPPGLFRPRRTPASGLLEKRRPYSTVLPAGDGSWPADLRRQAPRCAASAAANAASTPPSRARASLRALFDSKGIYVNAYDTRLAMAMFRGDEANAVRVIELAWQWCDDHGLSKSQIERLMRHFQHCNRYAALREWETTSQLNWQLFDSYLAAAAAEPAGDGVLQPPASFADMLRRSWQGLERVTEMLTVAPAELAVFLDSLAQRLSPAAAGRFVASMPEAHPLGFQPGQVMAALEWLLETPPFSSMEGEALASFLPSVRSLLTYGASELQRRMAALQSTAGLTLEQAGQLVLRQPDVLRTTAVEIETAAAELRQLVPDETLRALLARRPQLLAAPRWEMERLLGTLRLWTQVLGVPADTVLANFADLQYRALSLLQCGETTLQQRLATLQQAAGLTAEAAGSLAAAHPNLLCTPVAELQDSVSWLRQHLPADVFSGIFCPGSQLLAASGSWVVQLRNTLQLWTEVLSTPLDTVLQQYEQCFRNTQLLAKLDAAELRSRLASLQQLAGLTTDQAQAAVMQNPSVLSATSDCMQYSAVCMAKMLPAEILRPLLASQPQLLARGQYGLNRMALAVQLWTQVVGVPLQTVTAHLFEAEWGIAHFRQYQPSTLRRRMSSLRRATEGALTAEQLASLVFVHPRLLAKQPNMVKEAGDWLRDNMTPETTRALLECDPSLLGASQWKLNETAAKLRLWTDIVGVPLATVLQRYASCVGDIDILLPDLAAAYMLVQERAPAQLRAADGSGKLDWWLDRPAAVRAMGLPEAAAARMMEHFVQSSRGKDLVASLRNGSSQGWPLPGGPPLPPETVPAGSPGTAGTAGTPGAARRTSASTLRTNRTEMDQHNLHRIASMSEVQLRNRIRKITKRGKMRSFVLELEECGLTDLAEEARARLASL